MNSEELINDMINTWEEDTMFLSSNNIDHPAFTITKRIHKDISIPVVLKRMEKSPTWFFIILYDLVPVEEWPNIPKNLDGMIVEQTKIWLKWGKEKGYLNGK